MNTVVRLVSFSDAIRIIISQGEKPVNGADDALPFPLHLDTGRCICYNANIHFALHSTPYRGQLQYKLSRPRIPPESMEPGRICGSR